jgi:TonB family protein
MSPLPADSPALPPPPADGWLAGPKRPREGWTNRKFVLVLLVVFAFHIALIFLFATKKPVAPRPVANVPHLQLADDANEFIALGDPTLFARPNTHDPLTAFWRSVPPVPRPNFHRPDPPRYLPVAAESFGAAFTDFMRGLRPPEFALNFKPDPELAPPDFVWDNPVPTATTMEITGELAGRTLLTGSALPSLPLNDVIPPSKIQVLVSEEGNVDSAVVLDSNPYNAADQRALRLALRLRFAPAPRLMFGEIIFTWHTVPTNALPASLP